MKNGSIKRLTILLLAVCTVIVSSGCTTFDSFRHTFLEESTGDDMPVITIGVLEPLTGSNAVKGRDEIKGIELANSIYNNVDGYRVVLSRVDTQSKVSASRTAVQGLIKMDPVAIIGSAGEATSLVAAEYIEDAEIPAITPSATNPLITQSNNYYFRACITESQMGEGLAEYAYSEIGSNRIGVISLRNDTNTAAILDGFYAKIKKLAGKRSRAVAVSREINPSEEEIDKAIRAIRKADCSVCFVSLGTELMNVFFTHAEEAGLTGITYLGPRSWGSSEFVSMMSSHPDITAVFPYSSVIDDTGSAPESLTEEAQKFRIEYSNRYGADDIPTDNAALGYDSYLLIINAIHRSSGVTRETYLTDKKGTRIPDDQVRDLLGLEDSDSMPGEKALNRFVRQDDNSEYYNVETIASKSLEGKDIREALLGLENLKCVTGVFSFDENGNVRRTVNLSTISEGKVITAYVTKSETEAQELKEADKQH